MNKIHFKNPVLLLITAIIWGIAFVAQSVGMDYIGPFTFNFVRNIIGGLVLIPCIWFLKKLKTKENPVAKEENKQDRKTLLIGGICCGIALCLASNMQQIGIQYTTVGKAGFITALYIIIVPIMGIALKKKCGIQVWISVVIALAGFYLLSIKEGFRLEAADAYLLCSAVLYISFKDGVVFSFYRLFFSQNRRSEDVLYSVFCMWYFIRCCHALCGESVIGKYFCGMDSNFVCRCAFLWRGIYTSDCGTEEF